MGLTLNFIYYIAQFLHLLKSINRLIAIVFFVQYRRFFTDKIAKILIIVTVILGFINVSPFFDYNCNFYFNSRTLMWQVREGCEGAAYVDIASCLTTVSLSLFCDIITFLYLHFGLKKKSSNLRNDIKFLIQVRVKVSLICSSAKRNCFEFAHFWVEVRRIMLLPVYTLEQNFNLNF